MEDVLDLYAEPPDSARPVVCFDEKLVTLHAEVRPHLPVAPGHGERIDYAYERLGTANVLVMVDSHAGWRHVAITERRTKMDDARQLQWLADEWYPDATIIRLVQDHLNTHHLASLSLVYPPDEARRLAKRFEVHFTPKHGSWLNMAEIEIAIVQRSCLRRRIANLASFRQEVTTLEQERNTARCQIQWRFTTPEARTKLHRFSAKLLAEIASPVV